MLFLLIELSDDNIDVLLASSTGTVTYSTVRVFLKKRSFVTNVYKSFLTSGNRTITLSGNHLIYSRKTTMEKFYPM